MTFDSAAALRRKMARDPHRPLYHFLPPANWMNDPNGVLAWNGRYHLFYQHNPHGAYHERIHWGHAVSDDLVHWQDLPLALTPSPDGPDRGGCWSGCGVDDNGVPTLLYTGVETDTYPHTVCVATGDETLLTWEKLPQNPVIAAPPAGIDAGDPADFRDPFVWREGDEWYMLIAAREVGRGGLALLYRSPDLRRWTYLRPFLSGDKTVRAPFWEGTMWECPNLFSHNGQDVFIISVQDKTTEKLLYAAYYVGNHHDHCFTPRRRGLLDYGGCYYAPQLTQDGNGRILIWGWLQENRTKAAQRAAGWSGVMSLPRVLAVTDEGRLRVAPAPELQALRGEHHHFGEQRVDGDVMLDVAGDTLELMAVLDPDDAEQVGLIVRCAPDGSEQTRIVYDATRDVVVADRTRSSLRDAVQKAEDDDVPPAVLGRQAGEPVRLQVFVDRSVVEVFVNGRICYTTRIYPTCPDSQGVGVFARGGAARLNSLDVWTMRSIW